MSASGGSAAYCTLLLSDHYLPGAVVLAHSLRDNGSKARLVALFTPETLRFDTINELRTVYDEIIPVSPLPNSSPANLQLMNRPDLISTFTKLELWRQTQFKRIVYIDCDVVALRAPDELLSLETEGQEEELDFAAVPDVGWPDCFNSGVMVLRPNMQDYYALLALAEKGTSFDGADQGLLNLHFTNWHRLSFTYNCTPSANYQYIPAYRHFKDSINLVHYIGAQKPWGFYRDRNGSFRDDLPYSQLLGMWWAVYDRHYRPGLESIDVATRSQGPHLTTSVARVYDQPQSVPQSVSQLVPQTGQQFVTQSEPVDESELYNADVTASSVSPPTQSQTRQTFKQTQSPRPSLSAVPQYVRGEEYVSVCVQPRSYDVPAPSRRLVVAPSPISPEHVGDVSTSQYPQEEESNEHAGLPSNESTSQLFEPPEAEWDAFREPPPLNTKPEAINLQRQTYPMSEDMTLFQPPESYPEAPKGMYYDVPPTKPEPKELAPIFPWEGRAPRPTRVFLDDNKHDPSMKFSHEKPSSVSSFTGEESGPSAGFVTSWKEPATSTKPWQNNSRINAWDEVPDIQRYIQSIQRPRKAKPQVITATIGAETSSEARSQDSTNTTTAARTPVTTSSNSRSRTNNINTSFILTDFPTETERPSLPVTPIPIRKPLSTWDRDQTQDEDEDENEDSNGNQQGSGETSSPTSTTTTTATTATAIQLPAAEGVPNQEDWVGFTVEAFFQLLQATYLYWRFITIEPVDTPRRTSADADWGSG